MAHSIQDAARIQLSIQRDIEAGKPAPRTWRFASLKPGFHFGPKITHGLGIFPISDLTGEVCEFKGKWLLDGKVLLCENCWEDGT